MKLLFISLAPVIVISFYIYIRDKYEREPIWILITALLIGSILTLPIIYIEKQIALFSYLFTNTISLAAFKAFVVAAFTEEFFKMLALFLIIWNNKNFNEKFDGIVYAVFISLGFASVENLIYVFDFGYEVGVARAFTAVPAHAMFGIQMGYFFAIARFYPQKRILYLFFSFAVAFLSHGIYDFILMSNFKHYQFILIPFLILLLLLSFRQMKLLSEQSIYRNDGIGEQDSNFFGL